MAITGLIELVDDVLPVAPTAIKNVIGCGALIVGVLPDIQRFVFVTNIDNRLLPDNVINVPPDAINGIDVILD